MAEIDRERMSPEERLESLFQRHYRDVDAYVRRRAAPDLVDDVVADTFLVAWRRLDHVPADARPWLLGVARKTLATQYRSAARRRSLLTKLESSQRPTGSEPPVADLGVSAALARLSDKDREAITLIAWDGLSPQEAARVLRESPVTFRVRLHRAKRRLRRRLESRGSSEALGIVTTEIALTKGALKK